MSELIVILDNIRSLHNVGSILRTCDGFGVKQVWVCGLTPYPKIKDDVRLPHVSKRAHQQISKTALGAENSVDVRHLETLEKAINELHEKDIPVWAIEQSSDSVQINTINLPETPVAIVLGNEVEGVDMSHDFDKTIEIPMIGQKESFNVSVTAGIVIYQLTQK